jgi:hypothetical protein
MALTPQATCSFHRRELWPRIASASGRNCGGGLADFRLLRQKRFRGRDETVYLFLHEDRRQGDAQYLA